MAMATSTFSPPLASHQLCSSGTKQQLLLAPFPRLRAGVRHLTAYATAGEVAPMESPVKKEAEPSPATSNRATVKSEAAAAPRFSDSRWMNGTWDLALFWRKGGAVDWDAVIDVSEIANSPLPFHIAAAEY